MAWMSEKIQNAMTMVPWTIAKQPAVLAVPPQHEGGIDQQRDDQQDQEGVRQDDHHGPTLVNEPDVQEVDAGLDVRRRDVCAQLHGSGQPCDRAVEHRQDRGGHRQPADELSRPHHGLLLVFVLTHDVRGVRNVQKLREPVAAGRVAPVLAVLEQVAVKARGDGLRRDPLTGITSLTQRCSLQLQLALEEGRRDLAVADLLLRARLVHEGRCQQGHPLVETLHACLRLLRARHRPRLSRRLQRTQHAVHVHNLPVEPHLDVGLGRPLRRHFDRADQQLRCELHRLDQLPGVDDGRGRARIAGHRVRVDATAEPDSTVVKLLELVVVHRPLVHIIDIAGGPNLPTPDAIHPLRNSTLIPAWSSTGQCHSSLGHHMMPSAVRLEVHINHVPRPADVKWNRN
eukprot:2927345-Rhodomonas_salina.1